MRCPLLRRIEAESGCATALRVEVKAVLDPICYGLDAEDMLDDLRAQFVNPEEVRAVFHVHDPAS